MTVRPATREELYNLHHATARNAVERIFGIIKKRWVILTHPPQFAMDIQAQVPPALAALHNFILDYDPHDLEAYNEVVTDPLPGRAHFGELASGPPRQEEKDRAVNRRDDIAQAMWEDYQDCLDERGELE